MLKAVEISKELTAESIRKLVAKNIDAIHVPGFYPSDLSAEFSRRIAGHSDLEAYKVQNALKRLGMGYVDVGKDADNASRYHSEAVRSIWGIRDLVYPRMTPLDHFRLLLEEVWPAGATIQTIDGQKSFVGTCRVIEPGATMLPHNDRLARMLVDGQSGLTGQLAVNVYLDMPPSGGDLELWLSEPTPEQDKIQETSDGLERSELSEPRMVIRPQNGDLVLFNSQLIHCVSPGVGGQRVTMSCFVGYRGDDEPLSYWS
ncbi:2OG-Fe(II) oxygenase [Stappia sp. MMSF_3263]|uniref:2OG-Fe(II) oxygenase n=1 Tax=Stappia sp. MMSF_3263 TaxID=3046693 RepID=UPI00273F8145|nr:2OG-Fe(II) oxygenase [Stappia sp. MMSF_3263]